MLAEFHKAHRRKKRNLICKPRKRGPGDNPSEVEVVKVVPGFNEEVKFYSLNVGKP